MSDETISSSPQRVHRSILKARLHRKHNNKREHLEGSLTHCTGTDHEAGNEDKVIKVEQRPSLQDLYFNLDSVGPSGSVYVACFKPFEEQMGLVVADRLTSTQVRNRKRSNQVRQEQMCGGFKKCENLALTCKAEIEPCSSTKSSNPEPQLDITESELLQCCIEAEQQFEEKLNLSQAQTPSQNKSKSIIDSILEDFCSSPMSPELPVKAASPSHDDTPSLHICQRPIRTYSRRRTLNPRPSFAEKLENVKTILQENDDCQSTGSGSGSNLSVQEDYTELAELMNTSSIESMEHSSQKLCENMLNLSAYFSQNQSSSDHTSIMESTLKNSPKMDCTTLLGSDPDVCGEDTLKPKEIIEELIEDILTLRKRHPVSFERSSMDSPIGFRGFPSLTDRNNIIQTEAGVSRERVEEVWDEDCAEFFTTFKTQEILQQACESAKQRSNELQRKEAKPDPKHEKLFSGFVGFRTASHKNIKVSEKAKEQAKTILAKLPEISSKDAKDHQQFCDVETSSVQSHLEVLKEATNKLPSNAFVGFRTASHKNIKVSEKAREQAFKILAELPEITNKDKAQNKRTHCDTETSSIRSDIRNENVRNDGDDGGYDGWNDDYDFLSEFRTQDALGSFDLKGVCSKNTENAFCLGFQTASNKSIKITATARERATKILENLPELVVKSEKSIQKNNHLFGNQISTPRVDFVVNNGTKQILEKRALRETKNINQQIIEKKQESFTNDRGSHLPPASPFDTTKELVENPKEIIGFRTASSKSIEISKTALLRAQKILVTLPEIPNKEERTTKKDIDKTANNSLENRQNPDIYLAEEELANIQLSEWPLCPIEESPKIIPNTTSSTKRKLSVDADELETPKTNIAPMKSLPTTTTTPVLESNVPELPNSLRTNNNSTNRAISRRNLLSLSKRRKLRNNAENGNNLSSTSTEYGVNATPIKPLAIPQTPITPNQMEFLDNVNETSTPHLTKSKSATELESDFHHIDWENEHTSKSFLKCNSATQFSEKLASNRKLGSANPTPRERIERLRMYGEPPPVTAIRLDSHNNWRPVGLRRPRSMLKKS